jgi:hypothetical protein
MKASRLSLAVTMGLLAMTSVARADEPAAAPVGSRPIDREEETSWYGWQTLAADGTSLLVLPIAAGVSQSPALGVVAVAGYFLAPPFIHGAHGRWSMFAASLGLRVLTPVLGGLLGSALDHDCRGDLCIPVGAGIGVAVGVLGAVALDASLLSYETVEPDPRYRGARTRPTRVMWSPSIAPRKEGGFTLGLGAAF